MNGAGVDKVRCYQCGEMFEPYANEKFCSDECHDAYPADRWPRDKWGPVPERGVAT